MSSGKSRRYDGIGKFINEINTPNIDELTQIIHAEAVKTEQSQKAKSQEINPKGINLKRLFIRMGAIMVIALIIVFVKFNGSNPNPQIATVDTILVDADTIKPTPFVTDAKIQTTLGNATYTGEIDKDGLPHGQGTATWEKGDGIKYDGEWVHGNMEGQTTYTLRNGDTFVGTFKDNRYQKGVYKINATGERYDGTFKDDSEEKGNWYDKNGEEIHPTVKWLNRKVYDITYVIFPKSPKGRVYVRSSESPYLPGTNVDSLVAISRPPFVYTPPQK